MSNKLLETVAEDVAWLIELADDLKLLGEPFDAGILRMVASRHEVMARAYDRCKGRDDFPVDHFASDARRLVSIANALEARRDYPQADYLKSLAEKLARLTPSIKEEQPQ